MKPYRYLLRAEAVFIQAFCDDTTDLSTARGGGLALLESPDLIRRLLEERAPSTGDPSTPCLVSEITPGASVGMCELTVPAANADQANAAVAGWRDAVARALGEAPADGDRHHDLRCALRHACFVLDVVPLDGDAPATRAPIEAATAANRWRQLQQGSVRWPEEPRNGGAKGPCVLDGVRPASAPERGPDGSTRWLSAAVGDRRHFGRAARSDLYRRVSTFETERRFSQSLAELTLHPPHPRLDGKMAVVYADVNGLSELVAPLQSVAERCAFDQRLRSQQGDMLSRYLIALDRRLPESQPVLPIETLLWGGDEALWVLPAWEAWPFLSNLLTHRFVASAPGRSVGSDVALSFGVGLVFCNHKAPIRRIKALAHDLCDIAKDRGKLGAPGADTAPGERKHYRSFVAYEVLESFDHLGMPARRFREHRAETMGVDVDQLLLPANTLAATLAALSALRDLIPGTVLTRAARDRDAESLEARERALGALRTAPSGGLDLEAAHDAFGATLWLHLKDLHDYLPDLPLEAS